MINICRTCGEVTRTVYAECLYEDQKETLLHQIEVLTGLWLGYNDSMPASICAYCVQDLKQAVAFRERCIKVQVKLHRQYTSESKLKKPTVNDLDLKIIKRDEYFESKLQIIRLDTATKLRNATLKRRQDSPFTNKRYIKTPTEEYQIDHDPLVMDNSNTSEGSEEMDDETYAELVASAYEEIEDKSDEEVEANSYDYDSNFDDWADLLLNSEDDQEIKVEPDIGEVEESVGLSVEEEEFQAQEQLISTTVDNEKNSYRTEMLDKGKPNRKYTLRSRRACTENNQLREEQQTEEEDHIIKKSECDKDEQPASPTILKTEVKPDAKNIPLPGKTKRKYTFITRKPASTEKKKYKPTRSEYVCEICGKSYTKLFTFSEHKLHHTGIKGFKCTECPKAFFTKRLLKQHIIKHTDERPFVCRICSLTFRSRAHRNDHEKKHMNPQPWPCRFCGKKLTTSYARDLHEAAHRGVRKHHCETCDRGFITRKHLMSHKQTKLHKQNLERVKEDILESDMEFLE